MLLTSRPSFKTARRHFKRFNVVPVLLFLVLGGVAFSLASQKENLREHMRDFIYDGSALFLSLIEKPFNSFEGYKQNLNRHLYLQKNAQALERVVAQLKTAQNKTKSLEIRNKELRHLLTLQGGGTEPFITLPCFGQHAFLNSQALFVHGGRQNGLHRFDVVLSEGAIIGQVDSVGSKTSRVLLINDPGSKIPVVCEHSQLEGILSGDEKGGLRLSFVSKTQKLQVGETLFSSGIDGYFPRGKPLGTVSEVDGETVQVSPLVDVKMLHYVQVQQSHGGDVQ